MPIFENSCTVCHGPAIQEAGLRLDTEIAVLVGGISGHTFIPGESEDSLLVKHLLGQNVPQMPFNETPLPPKTIALIRSWIDSSKLTSFKTTTSSENASHWAYVKPERPPLPEVHTTDWARNPIDRFVLSTLEGENLSPSPEASSATLLRRLTLDLTGLPPTVQELDAFLADSSPTAYEATVERLLASPHYGERWARPWLDLARYADTDGYEKDLPRTIWKYRDWVINAFNQNGIDVINHLPGVGKNLQDHLEIYIQHKSKKKETLYNLSTNYLTQAIEGIKWFLFKRGLLVHSHLELGGFVTTESKYLHPNLQYHFFPSLVINHGLINPPFDGFQFHVSPNRPKSRGFVKLKSPNPKEDPFIQFNYLQEEEDLLQMREGVRIARKIFSQPSFKPYLGEEIRPGKNCNNDEINEIIMRTGININILFIMY